MSGPKISSVGFKDQSLELTPALIGFAANKNSPKKTTNLDAVSPEQKVCASVHFLSKYGAPTRMLEKASRRAAINGTTAAAELIAYRGMEGDNYYKLLAQHLNVRFVERDEIEEIFLPNRDPLAALHPNYTVWARITGSQHCALVSPSPRLIQRLEQIVSSPEANSHIAITSPSIMKSVMLQELAPELTKVALNQLAEKDLNSSAKTGANAWQGALLLGLVILVIAFSSINPSATAFGIHLLVSGFFIGCVALRLLAVVTFQEQKSSELKPVPDREKPTYSVLVPLLDEADVIPDLIRSMRALRWPRSKLEIKLICEADDRSTIAALEAADLDPQFEIIIVPASDPQTKPKALCYAVSFTTGKYITVYDAEDRPHPDQLLEAYAALENSDDKLACVQAPLTIANVQHNFWTKFFHFEYAGLFGGLLPWLARNGSPILLGGTSNHFSREALLDIGFWDPYNVTEDADLGLRIWRKGYRTTMITRPTVEDAPKDFNIWLPQRTRWLKGWMQTWIVQGRRPNELRTQMPLSAFLITQILLVGTIVSALLHPLVLAKAIIFTCWMIWGNTQNIWTSTIAIVDWATVLLSYLGFAILCWRSAEPATRRKFGAILLLTPIYWMAISFAAWRAVGQLVRNPFYWEKTPHPPHEKSCSAPLN